MPERWVLNASPIIVLARVGQEHLFDALTDEIVVPRAVAEEIEAGRVNDPVLKAARREEGPFPRRMYTILYSWPVHGRVLGRAQPGRLLGPGARSEDRGACSPSAACDAGSGCLGAGR